MFGRRVQWRVEKYSLHLCVEREIIYKFMNKTNPLTPKKELLIYAHYYIPDVASTAQIIKELAEELLDVFSVTVICTVPSYEGVIDKKYTTQKYYMEIINDVKVLRIRVPEFSKSNKRSRIKNIFNYFVGALIATFKVGKQDYVFSISQPPILGGLLGVWGKWIKGAKLIYNIQDFNPEQIMAIKYSHNPLILRLMMCIDKFSCAHSNLVITVGRDLIETLNKRFQGKTPPNSLLINNWIDEKEVFPLNPNNNRLVTFKKQYGLDNKFVIMYSGNLGLYYDLESLMKIIGKFKSGTKTPEGKEVVFVFVGAGSVLEKLINYRDEHHMNNVIFIPYQKKENLNYSLNAGDVHWVVNAKGIKGVSCPSKFYGIAAAGKPVLGVLECGSEIQCLIKKIGCGLVCEPGNYEMIAKNIQWFIDHAHEYELAQMGKRAHEYLIKNLSKNISLQKYKNAILGL